MKTIKTIILITLLFSVVFIIACSSIDVDENIIGTWEGAVYTSPKYVFSDNGKFEYYYNNELRDKGKFTASNGQLVLKYSNKNEVSYSYYFGTYGFLMLNGGEYKFRKIS